jgi:ankyrin repeat protein
VVLVLEEAMDLHVSAESGDVAMIRSGDAPLHHASTAETVRLLLEAGAELHLRNPGGGTPLFRSVRAGHASAVTALVQAGTPRDASDLVLWTGLFLKAIGGNAEAVTTLVAASEERHRRLDENGHFARSPVQLAELHTTPERREELRSALADA